jgi:lysophospholipase L1-like esterase|eukprot:6152318-Prymnesium_polylepis.2
MLKTADLPRAIPCRALFLLLPLCLLLFVSARVHQLLLAPACRRWPFAACRHGFVGRPCEEGTLGQRRIACVGDSITSGQQASTPDRTYPGVLQARLGRGYHVENLGACGHTIVKRLMGEPNAFGPLPYWGSPQFRRLLEGAPWDAVVLSFGTNDFGFDKDSGCQHDGKGCTFDADFASMVQLVRSLGRDGSQPLILIGVPPQMVDTPTDGRRASDYGLNAVAANRALPHVRSLFAGASDLRVVGLVDDSVGNSSVQRCGTSPRRDSHCALYCDPQSCDSVHPNDVGNALIAEHVLNGLSGTFDFVCTGSSCSNIDVDVMSHAL